VVVLRDWSLLRAWATRSQGAGELGSRSSTKRAHTPYVYRDFGSLVSLGLSTVGNLMGFLVRKNFFIEGCFVRLMYRSLYKMHEAVLHGLANMILDTWPNLSPTQCARGEASLEPIRAKRSIFHTSWRFRLTLLIHRGTSSYVQHVRRQRL